MKVMTIKGILKMVKIRVYSGSLLILTSLIQTLDNPNALLGELKIIIHSQLFNIFTCYVTLIGVVKVMQRTEITVHKLNCTMATFVNLVATNHAV